MSLLYRGLRKFLRIGVDFFYVDIESQGQKRIPTDLPVVFAANHPNSIMDTVVLGSQTDRQISYLARSGLFKNPLVALVFKNCGVIPLYRRQDSASGNVNNDDSFRAAFDVLSAGGSIGIFPEGQNAPERHVRDIKTGTARIALGAENQNDFSLGVRVIPVGLNFKDRDRFLTRVLVRFGEPIDSSTYKERYAEDPKQAVRELTDEIQSALREQAVHIADTRDTQFVTDVHEIYGRKVIDDLLGKVPDVRGLEQRLRDRVRGVRGKRTDLDDYFLVKQRIADAVTFFREKDPERLEKIRDRVTTHKDRLRRASLRVDFVRRPASTLSTRKEAIKFTAYAILLAPVALFGLAHNIAPGWLTVQAIKRAPDEAMRAIRALGVGMLTFGAFYALYGWLFYQCTLFGEFDHSLWWLALYMFLIPTTGFWFLRYRRQLARYSDRIVVRTLFRTRKRLFRSLLLDREHLLMELDTLRGRFLEGRDLAETPPPDSSD